MPFTRAAADATLLNLCGAFAAAAGVSLTPSGSPTRVVAFDAAESLSLLACGVNVADPTAPADADFALLASASWPKFVDIASFLVLENAAFAAAAVTKRKLPDVEITRDASGLLKALELKRKLVLDLYGYGLGTLTTGVIRVNTRCRNPEF